MTANFAKARGEQQMHKVIFFCPGLSGSVGAVAVQAVAGLHRFSTASFLTSIVLTLYFATFFAGGPIDA